MVRSGRGTASMHSFSVLSRVWVWVWVWGGGGGGRFIDAGFRLVVVGVAVWWGGGWWGAVLKGKVLTCVVRSGRGVASMQGFDLVVVGGAVCSAGERV